MFVQLGHLLGLSVAAFVLACGARSGIPSAVERSDAASGGTAGRGGGAGGAVTEGQAGSGGQTPNGGQAGSGGRAGSGGGGEAGAPTRVVHLALGYRHSCAVLSSGSVRCWGDGSYGTLGYGNTQNIGDDENPASAGDVNVGGAVSALGAGLYHTCAVLGTGHLRCWGFGTPGQLGYGNTGDIGDDETPASAGNVDVGGPIVEVAAGSEHTCGVLASGTVRCWGVCENGMLGNRCTQTIGDNETPASADPVDVGGPVVQIGVGASHVCALLVNGRVRCWGSGSRGQLGYGNTATVGDDETPASVGDVDIGGRAVQLAVGVYHNCALLGSGAVRCWGAAFYGALGYGNTTDIGDDETPASAGDVNVGGPVTQLVAGYYFTCALLATGAVRCWGLGESGQLGHASTENIGDNENPASAGDVEIGGTVASLAAGAEHVCALLTTGAVRCWGRGRAGVLGYGNTESIGDDETPASAGDVVVF